MHRPYDAFMPFVYFCACLFICCVWLVTYTTNLHTITYCCLGCLALLQEECLLPVGWFWSHRCAIWHRPWGLKWYCNLRNHMPLILPLTPYPELNFTCSFHILCLYLVIFVSAICVSSISLSFSLSQFQFNSIWVRLSFIIPLPCAGLDGLDDRGGGTCGMGVRARTV